MGKKNEKKPRKLLTFMLVLVLVLTSVIPNAGLVYAVTGNSLDLTGQEGESVEKESDTEINEGNIDSDRDTETDEENSDVGTDETGKENSTDDASDDKTSENEEDSEGKDDSLQDPPSSETPETDKDPEDNVTDLEEENPDTEDQKDNSNSQDDDSEKDDSVPAESTDEQNNGSSFAPEIEDADRETAGNVADVEEDDTVIILSFRPLKVTEYEFTEKPEFEDLQKMFPDKLEVTLARTSEPENSVESDAEDKEKSVGETTEVSQSVEVIIWECDEDYENTELEEYIFRPVLNLMDYDMEAQDVPEIYVYITEETKITEETEILLTAETEGVEVTVKADAGVLPDGVTLKVRKIENESRLTQLKSAIEEMEAQEGSSATVREMAVFDVTLYKDGEEIQPDTEKGSITLSFQNIPLETEAQPEDLQIYHSTDEELIKEDAIVNGDALECSVEHFSEFTVVLMAEPASATGALEVAGALYDTLTDALGAVQSGGTIKLLDDVSVTQRVFIDKSVIFDLNGRTLSYDGQYAGFTVRAGNSSVSFQGGTVKGGICANNGTSLTITSCQIEADNTYAVWGNSASNIDIKNSTISCSCAGSSYAALYIYGYPTATKTFLDGCTIEHTSSGRGIYFAGGASEAVITGCNISSDSSDALYIGVSTVVESGNKFTITDSEISSSNGFFD